MSHSTTHIEPPIPLGKDAAAPWILHVGCWVLGVFLLLPACSAFAQTPPQVPPGGLIQLQVAQPPVDVSSPVTATAAFDPPTVRVGETAFYRVTIDATESSIRWPEEIATPTTLKLGRRARGQMTQLLGNRFRQVTTFAHEVRAMAAGGQVISNFIVEAQGQPLAIPAASLAVVSENSPPLPRARQLVLETSATNVFLGQPIRVRVLLPVSAKNEIEALREVQLTGSGLMTDKTAVRQSVEVIDHAGQLKPAFIYEAKVTPITTGRLKFSAQAFTAGRDFGGPITISGQVTIAGGPPNYVFLLSEPAELNVRPLPAEGELPGFTGAIGKFVADKPLLSTNRFRVGEPVHLQAGFHAEGSLTRFVPPEPPRVRDWQIIADKPPATGFTLIPLTDEVRETPAIPFSVFDPATGSYVDLTISALPVTVVGESLPTELPGLDTIENKAAMAKLSPLATAPGQAVASLQPLQLRGWFIAVQLVPALGFFALWRWDQRRRFWAAHPDLARRRQAKRQLRREKIKLQQAGAAGNAAAFGQHAVNALRIACAPHFPAHPQALVGGDVLSQFNEAERAGRPGDTVRRIFAAADSQFSPAQSTPADLMAWQAEVNRVLQTLEEKL